VYQLDKRNSGTEYSSGSLTSTQQTNLKTAMEMAVGALQRVFKVRLRRLLACLLLMSCLPPRPPPLSLQQHRDPDCAACVSPAGQAAGLRGPPIHG
jgi:hypothetical protein